MDTALGPAGVTSASSLRASPSGSPHAAHPLASREASSSSLAFLMEPVPSSPASKLYSVGELCPLQGDLCREKLVNVVMLWLVDCTTVMPPPSTPPPPNTVTCLSSGAAWAPGASRTFCQGKGCCFHDLKIVGSENRRKPKFPGILFCFSPPPCGSPFLTCFNTAVSHMMDSSLKSCWPWCSGGCAHVLI